MKWFRTIAVCCLIAIVLGCGGIGGPVHEQRLVGNLGLVACDEMSQMSVGEFTEDGNSHTLVEATVFAIGWDEANLVVKRHPREDHRIDKSRTEYFIVAVRTGNVYGPFDRAEYAAQRNRLGVAVGLDFMLSFRDLE